MKVLLIPPTYRYTTQYPSFLAASDFSCGFAYIAAALKAAGHQVFGCNPNNAPGYASAFDMIHDRIAQAIAETKPDMIGVGGICTDYPFLQDAMSIIRHYAPTVPVLMGAPSSPTTRSLFIPRSSRIIRWQAKPKRRQSCS